MWWVNVAAILLVVLIVWWFWLYKPKGAKLSDQSTVIVVDKGIYTPAYLKLRSNQPVTLTFLRKDTSPCAEMIVIPELDFSASLPVGKEKTIQLPAMEKGEYHFHCQMQMYRGRLEVV